MGIKYKIGYKTYLNDRLNEVSLHGKKTHPLYVQIVYERKPIFFKSYYFELFSKPKYFLFAAGMGRGPSIEEITKEEDRVIEFVIQKNQDQFSLELFKRQYLYFSKDLCDLMEKGFLEYLFTFLEDKGMSALAVTIREGAQYRIAFDIVRDMKKAFSRSLYDEMVENAVYYAPPYLLLYDFMQRKKKWPTIYFSVMDWVSIELQTEFKNFLEKFHPKSDYDQVKEHVEKILAIFKDQ